MMPAHSSGASSASVEPVGQRVGEGGRHGRVLRVAAVGVPAGVARGAGTGSRPAPAVAARRRRCGAARRRPPGRRGVPADPLPDRDHPADHLVPGHDVGPVHRQVALATCRSVRQTPQARTRTSSSSGAGSGVTTSTRSSGPSAAGPGRCTRKALTRSSSAGNDRRLSVTLAAAARGARDRRPTRERRWSLEKGPTEPARHRPRRHRGPGTDRPGGPTGAPRAGGPP